MLYRVALRRLHGATENPLTVAEVMVEARDRAEAASLIPDSWIPQVEDESYWLRIEEAR